MTTDLVSPRFFFAKADKFGVKWTHFFLSKFDVQRSRSKFRQRSAFSVQMNGKTGWTPFKFNSVQQACFPPTLFSREQWPLRAGSVRLHRVLLRKVRRGGVPPRWRRRRRLSAESVGGHLLDGAGSCPPLRWRGGRLSRLGGLPGVRRGRPLDRRPPYFSSGGSSPSGAQIGQQLVHFQLGSLKCEQIEGPSNYVFTFLPAFFSFSRIRQS